MDEVDLLDAGAERKSAQRLIQSMRGGWDAEWKDHREPELRVATDDHRGGGLWESCGCAQAMHRMGA